MGSHTNGETQVNGDERHSAINATSLFFTDMVFKSSEDLKNWVQNVASSLGYVIVTRRSKPYSVILMCDRGGTYKSKKLSDSTTTRITFSKKIDCPFQLAGKYSKRNDSWTLKVVCDEHNHEPEIHMESHAYARRLLDEETRLVEDLTKKNVKPIDILSILKQQNKRNVSSLKTIYNARQKFLRNSKDKVPAETMVCDIDVHTNDEHSSCSCSYINQFPNMFERYIIQVQDVKSDGNCGFRAIAVCLGFNEDAWPTIRSDLMDELNTHEIEYDEIFGRECRLQLHDSLNFFRSDIAAPSEHWMTMPDMGILIASRYNVVLHCLSVGDSMTYLPLWFASPPWYQHVAITIGHVNDNHYIKLTLREGYPVPPIMPQWIQYRHEYASAWITPYSSRLNMYTHFYHSHCNFKNIIKDN